MINLKETLNYILENKAMVFTQFILVIFSYLLIKYRLIHPENKLNLSEDEIQKKIKKYNPSPLINANFKKKFLTNIHCKKFLSFDVFNLNKYKINLSEPIIRKYGIGTCGPRGFYGTLDLHLELEEKLAKIFNKEASILYSNSFTGIGSAICTFCKPKHTIFISETISEPILIGVNLSRSVKIFYKNFSDLEIKLKNETNKFKVVIAEKLSASDKKYLNLKQLVELKEKYGFVMFLDESFSVPFLYSNINDSIDDHINYLKNDKSDDHKNDKRNDHKNDSTDYQIYFYLEEKDKFIYSNISDEKNFYEKVDLIFCSLSLGFPSNGGFVCGDKRAIDYQRLNSASYVFSASVPAFLTYSIFSFLEYKFPYKKMKTVISNVISAINCNEKIINNFYDFKGDLKDDNYKDDNYKDNNLKDNNLKDNKNDHKNFLKDDFKNYDKNVFKNDNYKHDNFKTESEKMYQKITDKFESSKIKFVVFSDPSSPIILVKTFDLLKKTFFKNIKSEKFLIKDGIIEIRLNIESSVKEIVEELSKIRENFLNEA